MPATIREFFEESEGMSHVAHVPKNGEPSEIFVSAEKIAKKYSVSSRAVLLWAKAGIIPSIRIGEKTVRFSLAQVRAALEGGAK